VSLNIGIHSDITGEMWFGVRQKYKILPLVGWEVVDYIVSSAEESSLRIGKVCSWLNDIILRIPSFIRSVIGILATLPCRKVAGERIFFT
jgi:hypothetical protein